MRRGWHVIAVLSLLGFCMPMQATDYDNDTLRIFSKITPRLVMMSSLKQRVTNEIGICIIYDRPDESVALSFAEMIHGSYPNGMKSWKITVAKTTFSELEGCFGSQLFFIFDTDAAQMNTTLAFVSKHDALSVVYDPKVLGEGADISLFLGRKVLPYLNLNAIRRKGIEMDNLLVRISKIYDRRSE